MADLTMSEALYFITNVLHIEAPVGKIAAANRPDFLHELIRAFLQTMPFQSLALIATPDEEKHVPRFEEIKASMLARRGGLCFEMNCFMKVLLEVLGYEAYNIAGDIRYRCNHVAIMVKSLTGDGVTHLVDVGVAFPIFIPVPLDFEKESPVYKSGIMTYKFVRNEAGTIDLMRRPHAMSPVAEDELVDGWFRFVKFNTMPVGFKRLTQNMKLVYTGPKSLPREKFPFATSPRAIDFRNGRLVAIKDTSLLIENNMGKVDKNKFSSREELLKAYARYFPHLPRDLVEKVLDEIDLFGSE